jgi:hypothetical protein
MKKLFSLVLSALSLTAIAQVTTAPTIKPDKDLRINLNDDGSHYIKATFTGQVWARYNQSNPGTTVNGYEKPETYDIGLRRVRTQLYGKVSDKIFVYTQFGINNFGYNSPRKTGIFFHDVVTEYYVTKRSLQIGGGLTSWNGFARYSGVSVSSSLALDVPLYQQTTNDANDQFLRKLSIYAKGKLGKLDYRLIVTNPMLVDASIAAVKPINENSDFAYTPPKLQTAGYFMYQFLDEESNLIPFSVGTYLGKKNVFNIGAGFQAQPDAMWHYSDAVTKDTVTQNMLNIAIDLFYDHRIGKNGAAITAYTALSHTDYGKNYIRSNGPMNPGAGGTSLSGGGTAFPMYGTGFTSYTEIGYLLPQTFLGGKNGQLQPYAELQASQFDRLKDNVITWGAGANWLIDGQKAKLTLGYQNRPAFDNTSLLQTDRKGMVVLQLQVSI